MERSGPVFYTLFCQLYICMINSEYSSWHFCSLMLNVRRVKKWVKNRVNDRVILLFAVADFSSSPPMPVLEIFYQNLFRE